MRKAKDISLDILFPPLCLNCRKHLDDKNKFICENCLEKVRLNTALFCPICRARLANNESICHKNSGYLLGAAGDYDDPVLQNMIHAFKYQGVEQIAPILGSLIIKYLDSLFGNWKSKIENFTIIPIPLHSARERKRGFNQAELLAESIARGLSLEVSVELKRIKNNSAQMSLKGNEARKKNIAGCFSVKNSDGVRNKNIILVDDVFTSGATIGEAVKVLKFAGARKIIALVVAKA